MHEIESKLADIAMQLIVCVSTEDGKDNKIALLLVYPMLVLKLTVREVKAEFYVLFGTRDKLLNEAAVGAT